MTQLTEEYISHLTSFWEDRRRQATPSRRFVPSNASKLAAKEAQKIRTKKRNAERTERVKATAHVLEGEEPDYLIPCHGRKILFEKDAPIMVQLFGRRLAAQFTELRIVEDQFSVTPAMTICKRVESGRSIETSTTMVATGIYKHVMRTCDEWTTCDAQGFVIGLTPLGRAMTQELSYVTRLLNAHDFYQHNPRRLRTFMRRAVREFGVYYDCIPRTLCEACSDTPYTYAHMQIDALSEWNEDWRERDEDYENLVVDPNVRMFCNEHHRDQAHMFRLPNFGIPIPTISEKPGFFKFQMEHFASEGLLKHLEAFLELASKLVETLKQHLALTAGVIAIIGLCALCTLTKYVYQGASVLYRIARTVITYLCGSLIPGYEEAEKHVQATAHVSSSTQNIIQMLIMSVASIVLIGRVPDSKAIGVFVNKADKIPKAIKGIRDMTIMVHDLFKTVTEECMKFSLGYDAESYDIDNKVAQWGKKIMPYFSHDFADKIKVDEVLCREVEQSYIEGLTFQRQVKAMCASTANSVRSLMLPLFKVYERAISSPVFGSVIRVRPVSVLLVGPSQIGKTGMVYPLSLEVLKTLGYDLDNWQKFIYARYTDQEYWDGYGGQPIVILDDAFQRRDSQANPNLELFEMIKMVNDFPFNLHMAELLEKANTRFNGKFIMLTSNDERIEVQSLLSPEAVHNRIDFTFRVKLNPECADDKGRIDKQKVPNISLDIHSFERIDLDSGETLGTYTYTELVELITEKVNVNSNVLHERTSFMEEYINQMRRRATAHMETAQEMTTRLTTQKRVTDQQVDELLQVLSCTKEAIYLHGIRPHTKKFVRIEIVKNKYMHTMLCYYRAENADKDFGLLQFLLDNFTEENCTIASREYIVFVPRATQHVFEYFTRREAMDRPTRLERIFPSFFIRAFKPGEDAEGREMRAMEVGRAICARLSTRITDVWELIKRHPASVIVVSVLATLTLMITLMPKVAQEVACEMVVPAVRLMKFIEEKVDKAFVFKSPMLPSWLTGSLEAHESAKGITAVVAGSATAHSPQDGKHQRHHKDIKKFRAYLDGVEDLEDVRITAIHDLYHSWKKEFFEILRPKILHKGEYYDIEDITFEDGRSVLHFDKKGGDYRYPIPNFDTYQFEGKVNMPVIECTEKPDLPASTMVDFIKGFKFYLDSHCNLIYKTRNTAEAHIEDGEADSVYDKIMKNVYLLKTEGGGSMYGIFVKDNVLLVPNHYITYMKNNEAQEITMKAIIGENEYKIPADYFYRGIRLQWNNISKDAALVKMPLCVAAHRDILKNWMQAGDISQFDECSSIFPIMSSGFQKTCSRASKYDYEVETNLGDIFSAGAIFVEENSKPGDCGVPIISKNPKLSGKIFGILVAGVDRGGTLFEGVSREMIENCFPQTELKSNEVPFTTGAQLHVKGNFIVHGEVKQPAPRGIKTSFVETPCHGKLHPITHMPAVIRSKFKYEEGIKDPLDVGLAKCGGAALHLNEADISVASSHVYANIYKAVEKTAFARVLTWDEAIRGIEGERNFGCVVRSTSPGYPFVLEKLLGFGGKRTWLGDTEDFKGPKFNNLMYRLETCERMLMEGKRPTFIFTDTLKDELRPLEKVQQGKTRVFSAAPMDYVILMRKYFLGFIDHIVRGRIKNSICVGVNVYSTEWDFIAATLKSNSKDIIAGDFSNYDGSLAPQILWQFLEMANEFYNDDYSLVRTILYNDIVNSTHIKGKIVYQWNKSLPSGNPFTSTINSVANCILVAMCWRDITNKSLFEYERNVCLRVFGDDNIMSVKKEYKETFNMESLAKAMLKYGMTYTDETKSGVSCGFRPIKDVGFLKRSFKYSDDFGRYLAPLDVTSIYKSLDYVRNSADNEKQLALNIENSLLEISLHGPESFNCLYEAINRHVPHKILARAQFYTNYTAYLNAWLMGEVPEAILNP